MIGTGHPIQIQIYRNEKRVQLLLPAEVNLSLKNMSGAGILSIQLAPNGFLVKISNNTHNQRR